MRNVKPGLPVQPSEEATARGLEIAREVGDAFGRAVRHMIESVADGGAEMAAGAFLIAIAFEAPEGLYHWTGEALEWRDPRDENLHVEVVVRDASDGRFVPGLDVSVTLSPGGGRIIGPHRLPFLWHPTLYHYGANVEIPEDGSYVIRVRVAAATFPRHDRVNGDRYTTPVVAEFSGVHLRPRPPG